MRINMQKFKIQEMINKNEDSRPTLDQVYREYIEFVNEVPIPFPLSILMLAIPHVVILADLLLKLTPDSIFIQNLAYLGISPMLYGLNEQAASLSYIINTGILVILLSPVGVILIILYQVYWGESLENGGFKAVYQKSFISCALRNYFISFSFVFLPVCVSYGTKILSLGSPDVIFGVLILVWALVNAIVIEYHIFELDNEDPKNKNLVPLNYPYHMLDMILIIIALVTINLTSGSLSQIIGLIVTALRLLLTFYVPFYNEFNQKIYKVICASSFICSIGLLVSYYNASSNLNLVLIFTLVAFLVYIHSQREEVPLWEQIKPAEPDPEGIQVIKNQLNKKSLYVKSFRSLIFLGRQNRSHRGQLQIEILKSKCLGMENVHKGGTKVCQARDVIKFQENMVRFIKNVLKACQKSVSILKFMQSKDGRKQILTREVQNLVSYLVENKIIIRELLELNQYSPEAKFLLIKTFGQLYYDSDFLKEMQKWMGDSVLNDSQKELKEKLFNDKSVVLFINILEEIGKVVKISKNLPAVLGYEPTNLLGLSINEIIPFSIKQFHDQNVLEFLERYSTKEPAKNRKIQFFAYNSDFHLQEVIVRYSWVMNDFNSFYMAGVIERVDSDAHVILTDQYGNLEGWTKKIGGEEFNLDLISISQRQKYNIMPLFPTLIKYMDSLGVVARTIFFKNAKPRDSNLLVVDSTSKEKLPVVQARLLNTFKKLLRQQQLVGACFAQIQFVKLSLCQGRVNMRQITIREFQTLENLSEITSLVEKLNTGSSVRTDKSLVSCQQLSADNGEKQERSLFSEEGKVDKKIDSNFTLIPEGDNFFPYEQLVFGQFQSSKTSFEISAVFQNSMRKKIDRLDEGGSSSNDVTMNYNLHKNGTLLWYVLIITIIFIVLLILNIVVVSQTGSLFQAENKNIINRNKAASIYLKSIYNPNSTYISRFANGSLLENMDYLYQKSFQYTTFLGNVMVENQYYLFNTQIPATLQRLITNPFVYSNSTVDITPPTSTEYYQEITSNYVGVSIAYHEKFSEALSVWTGRIDNIKNKFVIRFVFLCFCSLSYGFLLLVTYYRERKHKDTLEAFFKFEKEDLEAKIASIGMLVREFEAEAAQLNLLKEFSEIVKRDQITNVEFSLIKNVHEVKIKFEHDQQTENNLENKKYYATVGILIVFLLSQIVFLAVHMIINQQALVFYRNTPYDLDNAAKLIVLPNYLIADIYKPLPSDIKNTYDELVTETLAGPISSIPDLYPFLGTVPCMSCKFMYPVLTTNYKSFYSTFIQQTVQMKNTNTINKTKIQDLFYASDYVIENLTPLLLTSSYKYLDLSIIVYAISIVILCVAIHFASKSINGQIERFQLFLRFFSQETITKNKHMSRLFSNFQ